MGGRDRWISYYSDKGPAISSLDMKSKKPSPEQDDFLRARLVEMIDMRHELVKLEALIGLARVW